MVCDECHRDSEEVLLVVRGIFYTGNPPYVVVSILCKRCDVGEVGEKAKKKIEEAEDTYTENQEMAPGL